MSKYVLNTPIIKGERGFKICPLDPLWWSFALSSSTGGDHVLKDTLYGGPVLGAPRIFEHLYRQNQDNGHTLFGRSSSENIWITSGFILSFLEELCMHLQWARQPYCSVLKKLVKSGSLPSFHLSFLVLLMISITCFCWHDWLNPWLTLMISLLNYCSYIPLVFCSEGDFYFFLYRQTEAFWNIQVLNHLCIMIVSINLSHLIFDYKHPGKH